MAYDQKHADRIRDALQHLPKEEEKRMFRGVTFMVSYKMCVSVTEEEMMCRFDPPLQEKFVKKKGFRTKQMNGREYKGYGHVSQDAIKSKRDFEYWTSFAL